MPPAVPEIRPQQPIFNVYDHGLGVPKYGGLLVRRRNRMTFSEFGLWQLTPLVFIDHATWIGFFEFLDFGVGRLSVS